MSDLIVICPHVSPDDGPTVLWVENGKIQAATCFECAERINAGNGHLAKPVCPDHARQYHVPIDETMADGFYELIGDPAQWIKQPEVRDKVN
jgi:hypothetical protein